MAVVRQRKQEDKSTAAISQDLKPSRHQTPSSKLKRSSKPAVKPAAIKPEPSTNPSSAGVPMDMHPQLVLIAESSRTAYEKRVWTALCQIPRGSITTYGHLSAHLGSSPRAVGNALRRNPFAPGVPCHRVVATGGNLGGFKGHWPKDGEGITLNEKRMLLRGEGIRIDDKGKVLGTPWVGFV